MILEKLDPSEKSVDFVIDKLRYVQWAGPSLQPQHADMP